MRKYQCIEKNLNGFDSYRIEYTFRNINKCIILSTSYHEHNFTWNFRQGSEFKELKQLQCLIIGKGLASAPPIKDNYIRGNKI